MTAELEGAVLPGGGGGAFDLDIDGREEGGAREGRDGRDLPMDDPPTLLSDTDLENLLSVGEREAEGAGEGGLGPDGAGEGGLGPED